MSIPATREAIYWLLCDVNAFISTAIEAFEAGDMQALRTELKGCADYVREEIDVMEEETPDIENSEDPREDVTELVRLINEKTAALRASEAQDPDTESD